MVTERTYRLRGTADQIAARLAGPQLGLFTRQQLRNESVTDSCISRRLRTGLWIRIHPGVFHLAGVRLAWDQRVVAAVLNLGEVVVSHRSAARLHGFDGFKDAQVIEVTTKGPRKLGRGTIVHRSDVMPRCHVWVRGGIPLTDPARTLIDLCAVVDIDKVEVALDSALRRRLVTIGLLRDRIDRMAGKGRKGVGRLRGLLLERHPERVPESPPETLFRRLCRREKLPVPLPQYVIGRYRVDFAYPHRKIAIEIDSVGWHSDPATMATDREKQNFLVREGWTPIRFMGSDVSKRPQYVARTMRSALGIEPLLE